MTIARIDVASIRREQIVEAAMAIIAELGIERLSLSMIESRTGMSRGQLTYYFPTKESILLAVFDRLLELTYKHLGAPANPEGSEATGRDWVEHLLRRLILEPPPSPGFGYLQHTFLAQIGHREDFRQRLASLYEEWRSQMADGLEQDQDMARPARAASPRALATVVQALLHGLAVQRAVDPTAFDADEVLQLCLELLGNYLCDPFPAGKKSTARTNKVLGAGTPEAAAGLRPHRPKENP